MSRPIKKENSKCEHRISLRLNDLDYKRLMWMSKIDKKSLSFIIKRALQRDWLYFGYEEKAKMHGFE